MKSIPSATTRKQPTKRAIAALFGIGLVLAALGAELLLRIFWVPVVTVNTETRGDHPDYGFAPLAGASGRFARTEYNISFRHSAQRLRSDRILKAERAPGIRGRVLFLGDSFTYSIGTELADSFTGRLSARWPDVEIINSACTGYGQREELAVLDKLGGATKPDVTLISVFWNDMEDIRRTEPAYALDSEGKVRPVNSSATKTDPLQLWPTQPSVPQSKWATCFLYEFGREMTAAFRQRYTGRTRPNQVTTPEEMEQSWALLDSQFHLLKLRAAEIGTRLIIVHIPDYNIVNPASVIASVKPLNFQISDRLAALCAKHGIEHHDALPALKAAFDANGGAKTKNPLFYETDRHLTIEGNRVMSEFLATILEPALPPSK